MNDRLNLPPTELTVTLRGSTAGVRGLRETLLRAQTNVAQRYNDLDTIQLDLDRIQAVADACYAVLQAAGETPDA